MRSWLSWRTCRAAPASSHVLHICWAQCQPAACARLYATALCNLAHANAYSRTQPSLPQLTRPSSHTASPVTGTAWLPGTCIPAGAGAAPPSWLERRLPALPGRELQRQGAMPQSKRLGGTAPDLAEQTRKPPDADPPVVCHLHTLQQLAIAAAPEPNCSIHAGRCQHSAGAAAAKAQRPSVAADARDGCDGTQAPACSLDTPQQPWACRATEARQKSQHRVHRAHAGPAGHTAAPAAVPGAAHHCCLQSCADRCRTGRPPRPLPPTASRREAWPKT